MCKKSSQIVWAIIINTTVTIEEVGKMSRSRSTHDVWDQIFEDLVLDSEPPMRYIKDAVVITKNGARFRVSPEDLVHIVARERMIDAEQSDIQSMSLSIDFAKIKRDVNRWTNKFISEIEQEAAELAAKKPRTRRRTSGTSPKA